MKRIAIFAVILITFGATFLAAKPPLRDVISVEEKLLTLGMAKDIRDNCPTIEPRKLKVVSFVLGIQNHARKLGYTRAEIKAYTDSDADKERLREKSAALLRAKGVETLDPQSYCAVGLQEIQNSSQIGALLRAK